MRYNFNTRIPFVEDKSRGWTLVVDKYIEPIEKRATDLLFSSFHEFFGFVVSTKELKDVMNYEIRDRNIITLGFSESNRLIAKCIDNGLMKKPEHSEGYSVYVGTSVLNEERQMIAITGFDVLGLLYGVMDFRNRYMGVELFKVRNTDYIFNESYFSNLFNNPISPWCVNEAPSIPTRAIWTWGHVIYDYRHFFENMAKIRLNEIVIWNDFPPTNAKEVVECAHSYGIKVIFGYAWGWGRKCTEELSAFDDKAKESLKSKIISTYRDGYADTGADGIYFQSFTEMKVIEVGGKCVAQTVIDLVNDVAGALFDEYPDLHIQFGLHATSVVQNLDCIRALDSRVMIVWEDLGAFPYAYDALDTQGFDETEELTATLMKLRGENERFGAVFKGMVNLDWQNFSHLDGPVPIGERDREFIEKRRRQKSFIWKIVQANWLKNAKYVKMLISDIANSAKNPIVEELVEDGMLESEILFPVALYAELLWNPERDLGTLIEEVSKYPCVRFANYEPKIEIEV